MNRSILYKKFPDSPGVYLMKDVKGEVIYIGKAGNLKRRVSSYFLRAHDLRIEKLVKEIIKIDYKKTDSALEALILESKLIKKLKPKFNVKEKDDKSFLYVEIAKEKFPRVLLVRGKKDARSLKYGPFTSAGSIREALKILRRIFPWSTHKASGVRSQESKDKHPRPCFDYEIGLCPGTCVGAISRSDYLKNIRRVKLFLAGKKVRILKSLRVEMQTASKRLYFEKAEKVRRQIFALQHIRDTALINDSEIRNCPDFVEDPRFSDREKLENGNSVQRIEGYDISNISGTSAVGVMVVFVNGRPEKDEYRKFKIRTIFEPNDVGMIKEVLSRRFKRTPLAGPLHSSASETSGWPLPNLILVDGGIAQVNAARLVVRGVGLKIPVLGIAKGPDRKKNEFIGNISHDIDEKVLICVRDEAHRFAISYHKKLRARGFIGR